MNPYNIDRFFLSSGDVVIFYVHGGTAGVVVFPERSKMYIAFICNSIFLIYQYYQLSLSHSPKTLKFQRCTVVTCFWAQQINDAALWGFYGLASNCSVILKIADSIPKGITGWKYVQNITTMERILKSKLYCTFT